MSKIIDLSTKVTHATLRPLHQKTRTRWAKDLHQVGLKQGCRKYGRNHSKVIGNPNLKHSGVNVIWTTV